MLLDRLIPFHKTRLAVVACLERLRPRKMHEVVQKQPDMHMPERGQGVRNVFIYTAKYVTKAKMMFDQTFYSGFTFLACCEGG